MRPTGSKGLLVDDNMAGPLNCLFYLHPLSPLYHSAVHGVVLRQRDRFKADSQVACRVHAVLLPCHAAKGLECVFPFDLHSATVSDSHLPCHAHAML